MKLIFKCVFYSLFLAVFGVGKLYAQGNDASKRPFFEYKGNYGEQVISKKTKFKEAFGYNLLDMGRNWSPVEIDAMHSAFEQLPPWFHNIHGLKSLYRLENIVLDTKNASLDDIPASTRPLEK